MEMYDYHTLTHHLRLYSPNYEEYFHDYLVPDQVHSTNQFEVLADEDETPSPVTEHDDPGESAQDLAANHKSHHSDH